MIGKRKEKIMKTLFAMLIMFMALVTVANADDVQQLANDIAAHNAKCAYVQAGTPLAAECAREAAALEARKAATANKK